MSLEIDASPELAIGAVPTAQAAEPCKTAARSRTVIRPPHGWQLVDFHELWKYRELLYFLTWRDVKVRYKQTVLGAAWAILQPLLMMVVFSVFFGRLAQVDSGDTPYSLFAFAGLLPWTFFAAAIANAGNSVVGSERLITKIYFPRLAIPFASVGAALVDFVVAFGMLFVLMIYYQVPPTANLLAVPLVVLLFLMAALGVGTLLAALNVAYRDFRYVIPFLVQLWMFATPTIYMQPATETGEMRAGSTNRPVLEADFQSAQAARKERLAATSATSGVWRRAQSTRGGNVQLGATLANSDPVSPRENAAVRAAPIPSWIKRLLSLNPMTGLITFFRAAVLGGPLPWHSLMASAAGAAFAFVLGCLYFRRVEDSFADII